MLAFLPTSTPPWRPHFITLSKTHLTDHRRSSVSKRKLLDSYCSLQLKKSFLIVSTDRPRRTTFSLLGSYSVQPVSPSTWSIWPFTLSHLNHSTPFSVVRNLPSFFCHSSNHTRKFELLQETARIFQATHSKWPPNRHQLKVDPTEQASKFAVLVVSDHSMSLLCPSRAGHDLVAIHSYALLLVNQFWFFKNGIKHFSILTVYGTLYETKINNLIVFPRINLF